MATLTENFSRARMAGQILVDIDEQRQEDKEWWALPAAERAKKCARCHGKVFVFRSWADPSTGRMGSHAGRCDACNGTGRAKP